VRAIGRNLNQLCRALNEISSHLREGRLRQGIEQMRGHNIAAVVTVATQAKQAIENHIPKMQDVLHENVARWRRQYTPSKPTGQGA
jgi:predicted RNA-binding protein